LSPARGRPRAAQAEDLLARVQREIEARALQLAPLLAEYQQLLAVADELDAERSRAAPREAARGTAQKAILAALEHGSHTVSELIVVTAQPGAKLREELRRMLSAGTVTRARRDGKAAYALAARAGR
jgi:hypothetical protein